MYIISSLHFTRDVFRTSAGDILMLPRESWCFPPASPCFPVPSIVSDVGFRFALFMTCAALVIRSMIFLFSFADCLLCPVNMTFPLLQTTVHPPHFFWRVQFQNFAWLFLRPDIVGFHDRTASLRQEILGSPIHLFFLISNFVLHSYLSLLVIAILVLYFFIHNLCRFLPRRFFFLLAEKALPSPGFFPPGGISYFILPSGVRVSSFLPFLRSPGGLS